jgi:hypothetical protein
MNILKSVYRHLRQKRQKAQWRNETGRTIEPIYRGLLKNADVSQLDARTKRQITQYSREVLGSIDYAPWLMVYAMYRGKFMEGWIPDDYFGRVVMPQANTGYRTIGKANTLSARLVQTNRFPDKVCFANGTWFRPDGTRLKASQIRSEIFDGSETAFLKREGKSMGEGIIILNRETFDADELTTIGSFVVQRAIVQAQWFEAISPGCVATLRITTGLPFGGTPGMCGAYLRLGCSGARFVATATALKVPVIDQDGALGPFASDPTWVRYRRHPDTGCAFVGLTIPCFKEAVAICEELHARVPQFSVIGWDVAITDAGDIEIMELNLGHPLVSFLEPAVGPCFKEFNFERFAAAKG